MKASIFVIFIFLVSCGTAPKDDTNTRFSVDEPDNVETAPADSSQHDQSAGFDAQP